MRVTGGHFAPHHYAIDMVEQASVDVTLFRALSFTARQLNAVVEDQLRHSAGVSLPDFEILSALRAAPELRLRAGELGHLLAWEKSRLSHQVSRMERKGLIERIACESDQRGTWVALTKAGAAAVDRAAPAFEAAVHSQLGDVAATASGAELADQVLALGLQVSPPSCQLALTKLRASLETAQN